MFFFNCECRRNCGPDASQHLPLPRKNFVELRDAAIRNLIACGFHTDHIDTHLKNWCLLRDCATQTLRAVLIDVGHCIVAEP